MSFPSRRNEKPSKPAASEIDAATLAFARPREPHR